MIKVKKNNRKMKSTKMKVNQAFAAVFDKIEKNLQNEIHLKNEQPMQGNCEH